MKRMYFSCAVWYEDHPARLMSQKQPVGTQSLCGFHQAGLQWIQQKYTIRVQYDVCIHQAGLLSKAEVVVFLTAYFRFKKLRTLLELPCHISCHFLVNGFSHSSA